MTAAARKEVQFVLRRLPPIAGPPIRMEFAGNLKSSVHAATFIRTRRIILDSALLENRSELARILIHELFHFVWLRIGNSRRRSFEELLVREVERRARGELGWSAEWRKNALSKEDRVQRTRRWREYACESFCDTAAWLLAAKQHDEITLAKGYRAARRAWFRQEGFDARISI